KPLYHSSIGGFSHACGSYRIPHARIDAYCVYTNAVPCGHARAPGVPQATFAGESQMDIIARELGLDPLELRLRNALEGEDETPAGHHLRHIRMKETLRAAAEAAGWGQPRPPDVGMGIAIGDKPPGGGVGSAGVSIAEDGSVALALAVPDTGSGSHTVLGQVVAQELSLPVENVRVVSVGTGDLPPDSGASGSRVTHVGGQACLRAAQELRRRLVAAVARLQECPEEAIALSKGEFIVNGERRLPFRQAAADAVRHEGPIAAQAQYTSQGSVQVTCFCAQVAEVAVDRETGQVTVRRLVSAHDVGTILNPLYHQGQIEGGIIMGLGHALMEELRSEEGAVTTLHLGDVKVASIQDIPELVTVLLEPGEGGPAPYQGKAIGETANVPTAAAIANAVADAVGVRIVDLPITAEKVLQALQEKERKAR
ncbi:MAG TPA: molybdopterin cofactor-binding domain-containing protein, partial [Dehalococcoidia bacterium]|nr:molybdopterin cofactor-binding domain-containing protein [Dehalococcoidia bacterium]